LAGETLTAERVRTVATEVIGRTQQIAGSARPSKPGFASTTPSRDHQHARPVTRGSGKISGNLRRPSRYNRRLQRVLCISALFSIRYCENSRRFYDCKRAEGKRHIRAVLGARPRRVNVLWAPLRDGRGFS
jgi:hypothetical protein